MQTPDGTQEARILVVEDTPQFRSLVHRILGEAGYEIDIAGDGSHGLQRLGERKYDLLITDIVLPGMSGLELVRTMREQLDDPPPVLLMSGQVGSGLNEPAGTISGDRVLSKPFEAEALLAAVAGQLAR